LGNSPPLRGGEKPHCVLGKKQGTWIIAMRMMGRVRFAQKSAIKNSRFVTNSQELSLRTFLWGYGGVCLYIIRSLQIQQSVIAELQEDEKK